MLFALFVKHNITPRQYANCDFVTRSFLRACVRVELEEEARQRK